MVVEGHSGVDGWTNGRRRVARGWGLGGGVIKAHARLSEGTLYNIFVVCWPNSMFAFLDVSSLVRRDLRSSSGGNYFSFVDKVRHLELE